MQGGTPSSTRREFNKKLKHIKTLPASNFTVEPGAKAPHGLMYNPESAR